MCDVQSLRFILEAVHFKNNKMVGEQLYVVCTCGNQIPSQKLFYISGTGLNGLPVFSFSVDCDACGACHEHYGPGIINDGIEEAVEITNKKIRNG